MPKINLKQPIKEKIAKIKTKLQQTSTASKLNFQTFSLNTKTKIKNIKPPKLPKIKFKIKLNLKKKKLEPEPTPLAKTLSKGVKIIDKYPVSYTHLTLPTNREV